MSRSRVRWKLPVCGTQLPHTGTSCTGRVCEGTWATAAAAVGFSADPPASWSIVSTSSWRSFGSRAVVESSENLEKHGERA